MNRCYFAAEQPESPNDLGFLYPIDGSMAKITKLSRPVEAEGDEWSEFRTKSITALRYYRASEKDFELRGIEVTGKDFRTRRGVHVGLFRLAFGLIWM